jgi:hypothetical protein
MVSSLDLKSIDKIEVIFSLYIYIEHFLGYVSKKIQSIRFTRWGRDKPMKCKTIFREHVLITFTQSLLEW